MMAMNRGNITNTRNCNIAGQIIGERQEFPAQAYQPDTQEKNIRLIHRYIYQELILILTMTKIRKKAISKCISIGGKRICEILMIIPFFIFTSCGSKCDDKYFDEEGAKETYLRVYEIKSDIVRRIIKEKIIPYAITKASPIDNFFYIYIKTMKRIRRF